jgi:hypothetical protein
LAKRYFFSDFGTYGRHFRPEQWRDTRVAPKSTKTVSLSTGKDTGNAAGDPAVRTVQIEWPVSGGK